MSKKLISRRHILRSLGLAASLSAPVFSRAFAQAAGAINASDLGVVPNAGLRISDLLDQAAAFAASQELPLYLPPGTYLVDSLRLADGASLIGAGPATQLLGTGRGPLVNTGGYEGLSLQHLTVRAAGLESDDMPLVRISQTEQTLIRDCHFTGGQGTALHLEGCGGHVSMCQIEDAGTAMMVNDSAGLSITNNLVRNCANNGILIWRSIKGNDGTLVSGNRISGIGARDGGTGQNGNAINIFRANQVRIHNNTMRGLHLLRYPLQCSV